MSNREQFQSIVEGLTEENFATMRGYILDVVRAEYGPLIQQLQDLVAPADPGEPEEAMPEDPFVTQAPQSLVDLLRTLGLIDGPKGRVGVIHVEFR